MSRHSAVSGFSLIEMIIVVLIIGIIATFVTSGKYAIRSSRVQSTAIQVNEIRNQYDLFKQKHGVPPGLYDLFTHQYHACMNMNSRTDSGIQYGGYIHQDSDETYSPALNVWCQLHASGFREEKMNDHMEYTMNSIAPYSPISVKSPMIIGDALPRAKYGAGTGYVIAAVKPHLGNAASSSRSEEYVGQMISIGTRASEDTNLPDERIMSNTSNALFIVRTDGRELADDFYTGEGVNGGKFKVALIPKDVIALGTKIGDAYYMAQRYDVGFIRAYGDKCYSSETKRLINTDSEMVACTVGIPLD